MDVDDSGHGNESDNCKAILCRLKDNLVFTGAVNTEGHIEWDWDRVPAALQMATDKDHLLLKRGLKEFMDEFAIAQVSFNEFHYRGKDAELGMKGKHTMESRGLLLMIALIPVRKASKVKAKETSLHLLKMFLEVSMHGQEQSVGVSIFGNDFNFHSQEMKFNSGHTQQLHMLLQHHRDASELWTRLCQYPWCGCRITSPMQNASIFDIFFLVMHAKVHQKASRIWEDVGQFLWPKLLWVAGYVLEEYGLKLSQRPLEAAPLLKSKKGNSRRTPFINKLVLLKRVHGKKSHRRTIMGTHTDIVPANNELVKSEPLLICGEYMKMLANAYTDCHHLQVSWDPSSYPDGDEVMVTTVFSHQNGLAAYLPIQCLLPVRTNELDDELKALVSMKRVCRVAGFAEFRALCNALGAISKTLGEFKIDDNVLWKPLAVQERREFTDGKFYIYNQSTQDRKVQMPEDFNFDHQRILVSVTDQGSINLSVLDYVQYHLKLCVLVAFDRQHRTWNDLKSGMKATGFFKTFLSYALVHNVNYGPSASKAWFKKKLHH